MPGMITPMFPGQATSASLLYNAGTKEVHSSNFKTGWNVRIINAIKLPETEEKDAEDVGEKPQKTPMPPSLVPEDDFLEVDAGPGYNSFKICVRKLIPNPAYMDHEKLQFSDDCYHELTRCSFPEENTLFEAKKAARERSRELSKEEALAQQPMPQVPNWILLNGANSNANLNEHIF
eukprot:10198055-Karenia_brevis.AAC.1